MIENRINYKGCGIYAIVNNTNGKVYIGQSTNVRKRIQTHISDLNRGKHPCKKLQEDKDCEMYAFLLQKTKKENLLLLENAYCLQMLECGIKTYNKPFARSEVDEQEYYRIQIVFGYLNNNNCKSNFLKTLGKELHTNPYGLKIKAIKNRMDGTGN